jgi:hypothetical protein
VPKNNEECIVILVKLNYEEQEKKRIVKQQKIEPEFEISITKSNPQFFSFLRFCSEENLEKYRDGK